MKEKSFNKNNVFLCCVLWLLTNIVWASPPKPFEILFDFPDQGIDIGQTGLVNVNITSPSAWSSGSADMALNAITYVDRNSAVKNIDLDRIINFGAVDGHYSFKIPLTVDEDGEYEIRVTVRLQTENGEIVRSRTFGVSAESQSVWFGKDSIDHAVEQKILHQLRLDPSLSPDDLNSNEKYRHELEIEMQERARRARANAGLSLIQHQARAAQAIKAGDPLQLEAWWVGQGTGSLGANSGDSNFPMHGAKITVSDKGTDTNNNPLTPDISGYVIDGKFTFTAPRDNYSYKISMETDFPGIKADGSIEIAGSGIGAFKVVSQTASGTVYRCETEDNLSVVCSQAQTGSKASASAWSAFHGMAEMVLQAKNQLGIDKSPSFKVIFDQQSESSYDGTDINMLLDDRYDWDVVAHEFGHAIANETDTLDTNTGGDHDGSNQYDYAPNTTTFHNKKKSLELAISEGFGTWFGGALMQNPSARYNGKFQNIGDGKYDDTEDASINKNFEKNVDTSYFGEDASNALYRLLWDIMDSNNELNTRVTCASCKDTVSLNLNGLWNVLNGSKISNIIDFYEKLLDKTYSTKVSDLLKTGENNISDTGLKGAFDISYTFAEFGVAPYLEKPTQKTKLDLLIDKSGPKFEWSQKKTGTLEGLTEFTLALYTFDKKTLVFKKTGITANEYTLTESDIGDIKSAVDALSTTPSSLMAVIIGENDHLLELESGPYLSNPIEILINNIDRTLVVVVDSSSSNKATDPSNLRIIAAQETLRGLTSLAESQANGTVPDLGGAIDFDSSVKVLSELDDPDAVIQKLNAIDSSGGTNIAAGINAGVQILKNLNTAGLTGVLKDKAAIVVFTDGENNAGPIPVIKAIADATLNGIRVHYGFLSPFISAKSANHAVPSDAPPGYVIPTLSLQNANALPATIEEAVLASGGVYALIGDAESQVAFVKQIEYRGFTNGDNLDPGGQNVVGQTETFDVLEDALGTKSFQFRGQINEEVRIIVDTNGNFIPFLKIIDLNGNIIAVGDDSNADGVVELSFKLPYTGGYHAEVTSKHGNTGLFSIFVDVQNLPIVNQAPDSVIDTPSGDLVITLGEALNFTGMGADPDGSLPLSYLWSFGAGSGVSNSNVEDPGNVTFTKAGVFPVTFTVIDSFGLADPSPATITITVNAAVPTAVPATSEWALMLLTFTLTFLAFIKIRKAENS